MSNCVLQKVRPLNRHTSNSLTLLSIQGNNDIYVSGIESKIVSELDKHLYLTDIDDECLVYIRDHYQVSKISRGDHVSLKARYSLLEERWYPIHKWVVSADKCQSRRIVNLRYTIESNKKDHGKYAGLIRDFHTGKILFESKVLSRTMASSQRIIDHVLDIRYKNSTGVSSVDFLPI